MKRLLIVFTACLALSSTAYAGPIILDFTNAAIYGGATGSTFNVVDQGVALQLGAGGGSLHQTSEGIGINGPTGLDDNGEIGYLELFTVTFASPVSLYEISLQQLTKDCFIGCWYEDGYYSINGGAWVNFGGNDSGVVNLPLNQAGVQSIAFGVGLTNLFNDYSVAGLEVGEVTQPGPQPVPEPSTLLLMGIGVLGYAGARRRHA